MLRKMMFVVVLICAFTGIVHAQEKNASIEYSSSLLAGLDPSEANGFGMGIAVTRIPYRGKISYYRYEVDDADVKEEYDITTLNLSYRWKAFTTPLSSSRRLNLYLDGGIDLGSMTGSKAEVVNPMKNWDSPLGPNDVKKEDITDFYWAATATPVVEITLEDMMSISAYSEFHSDGDRAFMTLGMLFGVLF